MATPSAGHVVYAEPRVPRVVAKFILNGLITQFERDLPIWNQKTFIPQPLVVKIRLPPHCYSYSFRHRYYCRFREIYINLVRRG
jgi:hypothetical protein